MKKIKGFDVIYVPSTRFIGHDSPITEEPFCVVDIYSSKLTKAKFREAYYAKNFDMLDMIQLVTGLSHSSGTYGYRNNVKLKNPIIIHDAQKQLDMLYELRDAAITEGLVGLFERYDANRDRFLKAICDNRTHSSRPREFINIYNSADMMYASDDLINRFEKHGLKQRGEFKTTTVVNSNDLQLWDIEVVLCQLVYYSDVCDLLKDNDFSTKEDLVELIAKNPRKIDSQISFIRVDNKKLANGEKDIDGIKKEVSKYKSLDHVTEDNIVWFLENYYSVCKTFKKLNT